MEKSSLKMCIFNLKIDIFSLKIEFFPWSSWFFPPAFRVFFSPIEIFPVRFYIKLTLE